MLFVCDAGGDKTWFRIETEHEAAQESEAMRHAVERYFLRETERARASYNPTGVSFIERDIGLKGHIARVMPLFLTLRDGEGGALATAMLPPRGVRDAHFQIIIVGAANSDPYVENARAIAALGAHFGLELPRDRCYPYGRDQD